jgi:tetratricopeptide (TPR) repeat protein
MSITLNLVDHLLILGRRHQELGRVHDAVRVLSRLSGFRDLPGEAAEEVQVRLAELCMKRRRYAKARRHLTAALRHQPDSARYHYLMAKAALAEDRGDMERASDHFCRSLELDESQAMCRAECGLLAVRLGRVDDGLAHLRRALELAPEDAEVIAKAVKGFRLADRADEARDVLRAALFRQPKSSRFRKLWNEFQYLQLRQRQQAHRQRQTNVDEGPRLLPFVRPVTADAAWSGERHDGPAVVQPPHLSRPARRIDQRNVR